MVRRDFRLGFKVGLIKKDLKLVMDVAASCGAPLPATSIVQEMFCSLPAGEGESGT